VRKAGRRGATLGSDDCKAPHRELGPVIAIAARNRPARTLPSGISAMTSPARKFGVPREVEPPRGGRQSRSWQPTRADRDDGARVHSPPGHCNRSLICCSIAPWESLKFAASSYRVRLGRLSIGPPPKAHRQIGERMQGLILAGGWRANEEATFQPERAIEIAGPALLCGRRSVEPNPAVRQISWKRW
jgi:hypothetical protein